MKFLKPGKNNNEERKNFVSFWAAYVRTHPDEDWSRQQNVLINAMMHNAKLFPLTPKEYMALKKEPCTRK